nr:MAG TPA: DNA polymerase III, beta subunit, DNA Polymerase III, beta.0A [Caudoviricetes sp.]
MSDKEMNLAILNKLYEIADKVFNEGVNVKEGNYTASDLAKMRDSAFKDGYLKTEKKSYKNECNKQVEKDCFVAPMASVNVLSFVCSFCVVQIFALVAKFEKLASIGSKKRMFIKQKDNNEVLCTIKVLINKYYSKLSLHCPNDDLRPIMRNVCLDVRNGRAAASDGHTMMIKGLDVVSTEHFTYDYNLPLVNGKDFKKMCSLAKSGSTLTCKLVREPNGNTYWISECCGYYSKTEANRYVNYSSVLPKISPDNLCTINEKTWKGISKWLKKNKGFNSIGLVIIKHKENDNRITFTINGMYDNHDGIEISCECGNIPNKNFAIGLKIDSLLRFENFNFALGRYANEALVYVGSLEVGMMMPMYIDDEYDGFKLSDGYIGAYDYCGFAESFDMPTNEPTEDVIPAKVDNVTTEEKECATEKKTEQTNAPAKVVSLDKPSNKFSFDAVGVNVGDKLTFIDGTEVIAAEDNKVSFCGELFTLSGFCKEFMPDEKRTKSNSYRGCAFFFKDGVKLEKLFKDAQKKSLVSSKEEKEIAAVPDDTLDSVPNEHLASEKCTERTIIPLAKENVSEHKETASTAKVVAISIGVPSCLDIPPNNMRLDIAGNEPVLVRLEADNKLLVRFLGGVWCPDVVEKWVRTVERNKNKDIENVNDSYMFGVIENDRERRSSDFHVSFYYRG